MKKSEQFRVTHVGTGQEVDVETLHDILKQENVNRYVAIKNKLDKNPDDLTFEEMETLIGKSKNIKLDFSDDGYFTVKVNTTTIDLDIRTRGLLFTLGEYMSHEGRLVYKNSRPIRTFKDMRELAQISEHDWKKYISKDIKEYNLIKKETIDDRSYYVLNPLFIFKNRKISETIFIAFHNELREYLSQVEYLYLCKKYNINP